MPERRPLRFAGVVRAIRPGALANFCVLLAAAILLGWKPADLAMGLVAASWFAAMTSVLLWAGTALLAPDLAHVRGREAKLGYRLVVVPVLFVALTLFVGMPHAFLFGMIATWLKPAGFPPKFGDWEWMIEGPVLCATLYWPTIASTVLDVGVELVRDLRAARERVAIRPLSQIAALLVMVPPLFALAFILPESLLVSIAVLFACLPIEPYLYATFGTMFD